MWDTIEAKFEKLDDRFDVRGDRRIERIANGFRWAEGPVYIPAWRCLIWSDIPNDRMMRWDEMTGHVGVFRQPAGYANGHTLDPQGRLVSCEHGTRRVTRTEADGSISVLADRWQGKRFNSPNDVVVHSDGSIWFTDPSYGIDSNYEGHKAESEIGGCHVYRIDPHGARIDCVATDFVRPNGLAFSLDERKLFIADTRRNHIRLFDVVGDGSLSGGDVFTTNTVGVFDGIRLDETGRVWAAAGPGVHCYASDGALIGRIELPEAVSNLVFGGPKRNVLFVCATSSVYAIHLNTNGARRPGA